MLGARKSSTGDDASDQHGKTKRQPRETDPEGRCLDVGCRRMATPDVANGSGSKPVVVDAVVVKVVDGAGEISAISKVRRWCNNKYIIEW
jgi:hypothetical protein